MTAHGLPRGHDWSSRFGAANEINIAVCNSCGLVLHKYLKNIRYRYSKKRTVWMYHKDDYGFICSTNIPSCDEFRMQEALD